MAKYIKQELLIGENSLFVRRGCAGNCAHCQLWSEEGCLVILEAPVADVVEVVRCEDCAQMLEKGWCSLHSTPMTRNDFCSYGERRADNG